jgi:fused signal recognition particle receptor
MNEILFAILSIDNSHWLAGSGLLLVFIGIVLELVFSKSKRVKKDSSLSVTLKSIHQLPSEQYPSKFSSATNQTHDIFQSSSEYQVLDQKMSKSRTSLWNGIQSLFIHKEVLSSASREWLNSFEEILIESDLGVRTSVKLISFLKNSLESDLTLSANQKTVELILKNKLKEILHSDELPEIDPRKVAGLPKVILVVGVNGAGKTTTIGKLAFQYRAQGAKVLIAACDTFRAAAAGQLEVWKERASAEIEKGSEGEKPSTVAYRAIHRAKSENFDVLLIDTAGRLHTRTNLMNELSGILTIISKEQEGAPHETILVVDGTTGQNALHQAREFNAVTRLTGIVITKLDGSPKGGIVVAIKDELDVPIRYIGIGESVADLRPFDSDEFVEALIGNHASSSSLEHSISN